jgi:hypothetical protein
VFLVNLIPLVFQQARVIEKNTEDEIQVKYFCGEMGVELFSGTYMHVVLQCDNDVEELTLAAAYRAAMEHHSTRSRRDCHDCSSIVDTFPQS